MSCPNSLVSSGLFRVLIKKKKKCTTWECKLSFIWGKIRTAAWKREPQTALRNCVWHECNCAVVWAFFGIAFLWDWNENWPFPVLWPLLSFPNLLVCFIRLSTMARLSWVAPHGMAHSFIELDKAEWVILWQKVLVSYIGLRSYHQPEEFRKVQKKTPHFLSPPRILVGFHLGWVMHASPGRTLSQSDCPETTWKPIPSPQNLRLQAT